MKGTAEAALWRYSRKASGLMWLLHHAGQDNVTVGEKPNKQELQKEVSHRDGNVCRAEQMRYMILSLAPNTQLQQMHLSWHEPLMAEAAGGQICAWHSQHLRPKGLWGHREEPCIPR